MIVRALRIDDAEVVDRLVAQYPFKPYRHHRLLSRQKQSAVLRAEIDRALGASGGFGIFANESAATAISVARPVPWDSQFFRVPMGRIDYVLRSADCHREALRATLAATLECFRAAGVQHVALKLDVADGDTIGVAESEGFRLMDAIVTYIAHPRRPPPKPARQVGVIRRFVPQDTDEILAITAEAYRGYRGRFQLDRHLPATRAQEFYLEWARRCCDGTMADRVYVSEQHGGRLLGWTSVKVGEPVSSVGGAPLSVGSLGACRSDVAGAYAGLICAAAVDNHKAGVLTEAMTQNSNFAMVRVLEAVGAQYARAEYTFHAWLD